MRQSIVVKSFMIIVAGVAALGGAVFVGFRHASDVRGDAELYHGIIDRQDYRTGEKAAAFI